MRDTADSTDAALVAGIRAGQREAFDEAFARHRSDVYRFARHMTAGDAAAADDVTQDVFLALMRRPERFDPERGTLRAYLLGIARHAVATRLREHRWWDGEPETGEELPAGDDPLDELCRAQDVERVQAAVASLSPVFRDAIVSCDLLGLSYDEAAASLGCPIGTLRSRLHRARRLLAAALRASDQDPLLTRSDVRCLA